jgi:hypothetical protein
MNSVIHSCLSLVGKSENHQIWFSPEDRKRVEAAAKASDKNVSEWIRNTLAAAIGA